MMSDSNDINVELLPLKESKSFSNGCSRDDYLTSGADGTTFPEYGSTLLPLQTHPVESGKRPNVLPRFKERLREGSQRIRDKSRRWKKKDQKTDQTPIYAAETQRLQRATGRSLREMAPKAGRELVASYKNRRNDSEFDILEICSASKKTPQQTQKKRAIRGNDVQNLIGKDGKKKSDMAVYFDKEDSCYSSGDTIKGHVCITLTQDVRVKDLKLQFFGNGRVSWGEQRSYIKGSAPKVLLRNSEVFLDHSMSLYKIDGSLSVKTDPRRGSTLLISNDPEEDIYLPSGVHNYPFEFDLPHELPGTFDGRWGQVRYCVRAVLVRPWKFDIEREKEFTLKCLIDLNDEPELARPIGALGEFSPGIMCIRSGTVTVELRIGRRGYVPGESIQFYVEVENNSGGILQDTSVALTQHVTFRAGKKTRKCSTKVASLNRGETPPNSTSVWNSESVLVPSTPGTSCKYYKGIQIKYTVSLLVKYSSWTDEFCLSVPIVIGTTGLRRQTINTYLSMLGYGLTPRASPANARRGSNGYIATGGRPSARQSLTAPPLTGSVRHSSISSLQSVAKQRRISPASSTRHRREASNSSSLSKDNSVMKSDASFSVISYRPSSTSQTSQSKTSTSFKPKTRSVESAEEEGGGGGGGGGRERNADEEVEEEEEDELVDPFDECKKPGIR